MNKRYEQMPKAIAKAITTPQVYHKERYENGVEYYKEVSYTPDGDMVLNGKIHKEKISISRATCNFSGAYPYLFDVISYVCTHAKKAIIEADNYYSVTIPYEKFLDLALDDCIGQMRYLQNELYRMDSSKQNKLIEIGENTSLYAMPVVLACKAGSRERALSEKGRRGAEQLGKEPHTEIQILFLKCLFQDVKENDNKYIDFPKAFFAKLKAVEKAFEKKFVFREPDTGLNRLVDKNQLKKLIQKHGIVADIDIQPLTGAISVEVIYKLLNYFRLHDNSGTMYRLKGIEVLKHCAPQYIRTIKDKQGNSTDYYKTADEAKAFLNLLAIAINEVCRIGILNAPRTKPKNLITRIENVPSGDILIYYGNRKEKRQNRRYKTAVR
jgi:hypothetical protein